jgi:PhoH-like ATPase
MPKFSSVKMKRRRNLKKTFCLDTNVFLYDPMAIYSFEDNDVVIPLVVLEEIDKLKDLRFDDAGRNARMTNRILDELRQKGDLTKGVMLPGGGQLRIVKSQYSAATMPAEMDKNKIDNWIISTVLDLQASIISRDKHAIVKLITKDISMRIKCDMLGVPCDDYLKHRVAGKTDMIYGGLRVVSTTQENLDRFHSTRSLSTELLDLPEPLMPNEYVVLKSSGSASGLARNNSGVLRTIIHSDNVWGLRARNKEQRFALDALLDDNIKLATLIGPAGTGKTLLAIAAGLKQVLEEKKFNKLIVSRPIQPMGRDIGYLPGTKEEKMEPWVQPIVDNMEHLFGEKSRSTLQMYFENGMIEVEALTYIRGRSIPNAYIIIDEAQNLTVHELKTIVTRVGDATKIVLTGDIDQIDNDKIDAVSNGLTYAVEKFKPYDLAGHISLIKGERSRLATLAAEIL